MQINLNLVYLEVRVAFVYIFNPYNNIEMDFFKKINSKISSKVRVLFAIIIVLNIGIATYVYYYIQKQSIATKIIDLAGRNRMLSQRIQGMVSILHNSNNDQDYTSAKTEVKDLLNLHENSLAVLLYGGIAPKMASNEVLPPARGALKDSLTSTIAFFTKFKNNVNYILENKLEKKEKEKHEPIISDSLFRILDPSLLNTYISLGRPQQFIDSLQKTGYDITKLYQPIEVDEKTKQYFEVLDKMRVAFFEGKLLKKNQQNVELAIASYSNSSATNTALIIIFILNILLIFICSRVVLKSIKPISHINAKINELSEGLISKPLEIDSKNEIGQMSVDLNKLILQFENITTFSKQVGDGNFKDTPVLFNNKGDITEALYKMKTDLEIASLKDEKRNWLNQGMANFGNILRNENLTIEQNCQQMIQYTVKYINANQGALFFVNDNEATNTKYWEMMACAAYDKIRHIDKKSGIEEGLLGRIWMEKEYLYFTDVPQNYVHITSGIGDTTPGCLIIIPLKMNDKIVGAIEIASFVPYKEHEIDFLLKIADSIAATVNTIKVNHKTTTLLEQTQFQAESMRAQEEELRQNLEELNSTQEEMQIKENIYIEKISNLEQQILEYKN